MCNNYFVSCFKYIKNLLQNKIPKACLINTKDINFTEGLWGCKICQMHCFSWVNGHCALNFQYYYANIIYFCTLHFWSHWVFLVLLYSRKFHDVFICSQCTTHIICCKCTLWPDMGLYFTGLIKISHYNHHSDGGIPKSSSPENSS